MLHSTTRRGRRGRATPPRGIPEGTRDRILDAAERLFAERGIDAVSVRAVLEAAGVNVALANYHFGSREGLIAELLRSRVAPTAEAQLRAIEEVDARGAEATLEDVLRAYATPAAQALRERPLVPKLFVQLQFSANPAIRELGRDALRRTLYRLAEALAKRMTPGGVGPRRLLRLMLVFSAPSVLATQWEVLEASARRRFGPDGTPTPEMLVDEMAAFCAAGLRAAGGDEKGA